jgi:hypothetical protein
VLLNDFSKTQSRLSLFGCSTLNLYHRSLVLPHGDLLHKTHHIPSPRQTLLAILAIALVAPLALVHAQTCKTALVASGFARNATLNGDFIASSWDAGGATWFATEKLEIMCVEQPEGAPCQWQIVVMDYPQVTTFAKCLNCIASPNWLTNQTQPQQWLANILGVWAPEPSASVGCCTFVPQACDSCDDNACATKYTSFASCTWASVGSGCCQPFGWVDTGKCACKTAAHKCAHAIEAVSAVEPLGFVGSEETTSASHAELSALIDRVHAEGRIDATERDEARSALLKSLA